METRKNYDPDVSRNAIVKMTFGFSLEVIKKVDELESIRKYAVARQLIRSATSIGACVREAQNAESLADFIHKMKISAKEADETRYWLEICDQSPGYPQCKELLDDLLAVQKVLSRIISTSKKKQ